MGQIVIIRKNKRLLIIKLKYTNTDNTDTNSAFKAVLNQMSAYLLAHLSAFNNIFISTLKLNVCIQLNYLNFNIYICPSVLYI